MGSQSAGNFYVDSGKVSVQSFYDALRAYSESPELIVKFNQFINGIECLISENLADGLENVMLPSEPEKRAYEFVCLLADLMGLEPIALRKQLFIKHVNKSPMGTHCTLGLRKRNLNPPIFHEQRFDELEDNGFVVHLDHDNNIFMLTSHYLNNDKDSKFVDPKCDWRMIVPQAVKEFIAKLEEKHGKDAEPIYTKVNYQGLVWAPDWEKHCYVRHYKVKVLTRWQTYVLLICLSEEYSNRLKYDEYPIDANDRPAGMKLARIYQETHENAQAESLAKPKAHPDLTRLALMQDVYLDDAALEGPYASVMDSLNVDWPTVEQADLNDKNSHMDRLMAYYHTDRIQRYFRTLGLTTLDDYDHLNPVRIVLSANRRTAYFSEEKRVHFNAIEGANKHLWTDARNHRTIYHEYVHVVTDALVRLRRQPKTNSPAERQAELLQAAAMDEGLADYFASSLAAQLGDHVATYRILKFEDNEATLRWTAAEREGENPSAVDAANADIDIQQVLQRRREFRPLEHGPMNLAIDVKEGSSLHPDIVYDWCQHWARYLWLLRKQLGAEVADRIIANSIVFLTRWSSFGLGVLALLVADRQLFGGQNRTVILDTARMNLTDVAEIYEFSDIKTQIDKQIEDQTEGGINMRNIESEEEAKALGTRGVDNSIDPSSISYDLMEAIAAAAPAGLDFGQVWSDDAETHKPISANL